MLVPIQVATIDSGKLATVTPSQCAEAWNVARKDTPGFRESVIEGPHGKLIQLEVSSWVQVPYVLQRLHSSSMRVVFPNSSDPEQRAISEFLRSSHTSSIQDMLDRLANYIDTAASFKPHELPPPGTITCGAEWVAAHELSEIAAKRLTTTEVLNAPAAGDPRIPVFKGAAIEALSSGRPVIFTLPPNSDFAPIVAVLGEACAQSPDSHAVSARTTVWLPHSEKPNAWTTELPLQEFLQKFGGGTPLTPELPSPTEEDIPAPLAEPPHDPSSTQEVPLPLDGDALVLGVPLQPSEEVLDLTALSHDAPLDVGNSTVSEPEPSPTPGEPTSQRSEEEPLEPSQGQGNETSTQLALEFRREVVSNVLDFVINLPESKLGSPRFKLEQLEGFYNHKVAANAPSPIGQQTSVMRVSSGKTEQISVGSGQAATILERCCNRPFEETARLLFEAHDYLHARHSEEKKTDTSTQEGYLVTLPNKGKAIFVSDLEGDVAKLVLLIDQYNLIERWERGDQVFLCVLGDMVDRSTTGSLLVEFLLELKVKCGFSRQIIILPGNHELDASQNLHNNELFKTNKPGFIGDLFGREYPAATHATGDRGIIQRLHTLCPKAALWSGQSPLSIDEDSYKARWGLYTLFQDIFFALPRSIVSDNGLFASHAGFPMHGPLEDLFQEQPATNIATNKYRAALAQDIFKAPHSLKSLVWSDLSLELANDGAFVPINDKRREPSDGRILFSHEDFRRFCSGTGTSLMIRGHQSDAPDMSCALHAEQALCDREGMYYPKAWTSGNIVTVEPHATWSALLDLSISKPEAKDIEWIGLTGKGHLSRGGKYPNGRPLPDDAAKQFWIVTPQA